jgi:ubiquinone/menaquinone biosynthesis C-methylase UbiE
VRDWLQPLLMESAASPPVVDGILRFVPDEGYAASFGREWKWFSKTQLDRGASRASYTTFKEKTGIAPEELEGKTVLDVGCGMGRFADVVSAYGARVVGVDLSAAVESAHENLRHRDRVAILQASVFDLPFRDESFDFVYSIGVLHHTPDTHEAFDALPRLVKPGGTLAIWVYSGEPKARLSHLASDLYRRYTTRMDSGRLLKWCERIQGVGRLYRTSPGRLLYPLLPVSMEADREARVLDTFDWYSPRYQWKHRWTEVESWFRAAGFEAIRRNAHPVAVAGSRPRPA